MKKTITTFFVLLVICSTTYGIQKNKEYNITSPDGAIKVQVSSGTKLLWSVQLKGKQILAPSAISLQLGNGENLGDNAGISSSKTETVNTIIKALNYKKTSISDVYTELTLNCRNNFGVKFRVYNDGVAYRFFTKKKGEIIIKNEEANFNFTNDYTAFIPYMWDYRDGKIFNTSFEKMVPEFMHVFTLRSNTSETG